ncbi:MAG TPA: hypothetical protein VN203_01995 [Candidatus Acidoferrum sp.]|nr:hypothetical protein [Candidatus Acidoferrum sp.]
MNKRDAVRYDTELLLGRLSKVTISWSENVAIESHVENYCAHGVRVSLPSPPAPAAMPKKNDTVRVLMPMDRVWLSGMCVYASNEPDGSAAMGLYFFKPDEQNYLSGFLRKTLNRAVHKDFFVKHEWEELVGKLCSSGEPSLMEIGVREWKLLLHQRKEAASDHAARAARHAS